ncbi:platelet glycoprotein V [Drosophila innubila]|uniref:platelet glycoprotein V n=1 Tax=Drosophila innubila TaxID=198719 RepID=UPI00148DD12B|nr:platelet glycoprotein V [Drosophila innubila]
MSSVCFYLYLLWMMLMMRLNSCQSNPKPESVYSLECNENLCAELNYPLDSQVAYFKSEITKKLGNYTTLVLHNSQLTHLPLNVFKSLKQLENFDVYGCQVQHVARECFQAAANLKKLQLGGNLISHLDGDTFALASQLEELGLADNELQHLPAKLFSGLRKLRKLSLQGNQLQNLPADAFTQLKHLRYLNLDYNQLTKLPASLCGNQQELEDFSARGNNLQQIADNAFSTVQRLILSDNPQLHTLHFTGDIRQLQANNCELKSLKLDQPQQLKQLLLSNSKLRSLDFLRNANNLLELDLSGLEELPALPTPWPAKQLERLSISRNKAGDWPEKMISQMPQLQYLEILQNDEREIFVKDVDNDEHLDDNDWLCDDKQGCPTVEVGEADELLWTGDGFEKIS